MNMDQALSQESGSDWLTYCRFRKAFEGVMDPRLYTITHLDSLIWSGRARFWGNDRAGIVAKLEAYPTGAIVVEGVIAAGELDEIRALIPLAESWGRDHGAIMARIESRSGWVRTMKNDGYQLSQTALTKDLE
jgi:hypothetical protein